MAHYKLRHVKGDLISNKSGIFRIYSRPNLSSSTLKLISLTFCLGAGSGGGVSGEVGDCLLVSVELPSENKYKIRLIQTQTFQLILKYSTHLNSILMIEFLFEPAVR